MILDPATAWIWPRRFGDTPNQYVQFRHEFTLPEAIDHGCIRVSCDSNYALWLNGHFVDFGQYHDYPDQKTCDLLSLTDLRRGKNVLAFLVYYQGEGSFQYKRGAPGLIYELCTGDSIIPSGKDTLYRADPCYTAGPIAKVTGQLAHTFCYDASGEDDWRSLGYQTDSGWTAIADSDVIPQGDRPVKDARPIPKLIIGPRLEPEIVAQGTFTREPIEGATVAKLMQEDRLSPSAIFEGGAGALTVKPNAYDGADGVYLILDLGREEAGLLELDLNASAGTVVDVAWGEHLDDGHVRAWVGGRNFACRYVCREGRQQFTHYFLRFAGRYLQLHISALSGPITIHYAGLLKVEYPVVERGSFKCADDLWNRIYETSVRTLHLCMHEHYEDCPWREQSLYAMDMRNQALCGYYCFGDYAFAAASLDLLGRGLKPDGYLELCAPADIAITIPCFSMAWIMAVADHLLYSGNVGFAREQLIVVRKMLASYQAAVIDDLLPCPPGERYWHFYEWSPGLDGTIREDCTQFAVESKQRFDAPLNLFYCLALDAAAFLARHCGEKDEADGFAAHANAVRRAIHARFWDESAGLYRTYEPSDTHYADLTQALALVSRTCPEDLASGLRERLAAGGEGIVRATLSHSIYKYEALLQEPEKFGRFVFDDIRRDWGYMLKRGATSFWETIKGADDFDNAGSLCHGWSGLPVYFLHAYVLGVKPTEPGFSKFNSQAIEGIVPSASGTIPTPSGQIEAAI